LSDSLFQYLLRLGDDRLVLGHRLSEWCGHGPILEEDIALANIALDLVGQATLYLKLAGETEAKGRSEDALAYFRDAIDYRNVQIVELPKGDYAYTIVRQFFFDVFSFHVLEQLQSSKHHELAGIAGKGFKEVRYHVRHSSEWIVRMGDGTPDSHDRAQKAVNQLWRFTAEMFEADAIDREMGSSGIGADVEAIKPKWEAIVMDVLRRANLSVPNDPPAMTGGRRGRHTEYLGHMLATMQSVARAFPSDAAW
jgi:ring-1,2-phenylacetyl-CoA epoxidase subunit PaaC